MIPSVSNSTTSNVNHLPSLLTAQQTVCRSEDLFNHIGTFLKNDTIKVRPVSKTWSHWRYQNEELQVRKWHKVIKSNTISCESKKDRKNIDEKIRSLDETLGLACIVLGVTTLFYTPAILFNMISCHLNPSQPLCSQSDFWDESLRSLKLPVICIGFSIVAIRYSSRNLKLYQRAKEIGLIAPKYRALRTKILNNLASGKSFTSKYDKMEMRK